MTPTLDIESVVLKSGGHAEGPDMCVMELASFIAREPWSDHPACVSPVLGAFLRSWNDSLDDATRQKLKPYAARVIGTDGDGKDEHRAWMAVDWLARTQLPVWMDLAGLSEHAAVVRAVIVISDTESARAAQPILDAAGSAARYAAGAAARYAAWDAARYAAWDAAGAAACDAVGAAAWDAVGAAAWAAAGSAARDAAGSAARYAAGAAARYAAWDAAGAAACDAVGAAAWDAVGSAARAAAGSAARAAAGSAARDAARSAARYAAWNAAMYAAWDAAGAAAGAAAWDALRPSVVDLQQSAFELLERMVTL